MRGRWRIPAAAFGAILERWPRARNGTAIATIVILITAVFVFLTGLILAEKKRSIERNVEVLTSNFVGAIDQQVTSSIDKIDLVILALADELQSELSAHGRIDIKIATAMMTKYVERIPELDGLRVTDAGGTVIAATGVGPDLRANFSDREYFARHRSAPRGELIISKPLFGRVNQTWLVVLTRRYINPNGTFAGVITAPIRVDAALADARSSAGISLMTSAVCGEPANAPGARRGSAGGSVLRWQIRRRELRRVPISVNPAS